MEAKVMAAAMSGCFVSLPLPLIQVLEATARGTLPPVLALELRSRSGSVDRWHVAWSGSSSSSSAIEVSKQFAECISLPNFSDVLVKPVANSPKAELVTIEPDSEDDWEILELNSELAEEVILKQIGIVYEGMRFPLWLHGHIVVIFRVISTSPAISVVQLFPGTEVAVAPKTRKTRVVTDQVISDQQIANELSTKAFLRVQSEKIRYMHKFKTERFELDVVLTTVAFVHPETAGVLGLHNLELVRILPRPKKVLEDGKDTTGGERDASIESVGKNGFPLTNNEKLSYAAVQILFSESVAKGHIMLPQSLRIFIRVGVHSWVYLKKYNSKLKQDVLSMRLSPISSKISGRKTSINSNELDVADVSTLSMSKSRPTGVDPLYIENMEDCSFHDNVQVSSADFDVGYDSENNITLDNQCLVRAWLIGQLIAIASHVSGMNATKFILAKETLFHFKLKDLKLDNNTKEQIHSSVVKGSTRVASTEVMYLLTTNFEEASNAGQHCFYELALKAENDVSNKIECKPFFWKLEWGDPVFVDTPIDNMIEKSFGRMVSCPNWLETAASAVVHRLMAPLCRFGKFLSSPDISLPGHVLIHGPPGSGKTSLAISLSDYLRRHEEILVHTVFVSCSKLALERSRSLRKAVAGHVFDAMLHSPSVVIFDDLDDVVSSSGGSELAEFLANIMDSYRKIVYDEKKYGSCGYGPIVFIASVKNFANLPQILTSSGRFDFHLQVPALTVSGRRDILEHIISMRDLDCSEDVLSDVTPKLDGYDAHDLEILVDRAVNAAFPRLCSHDIAINDGRPTLFKEDLLKALHGFVPFAVRGLTQSVSEGGCSGWEDVGGLVDIQNAIRQTIELPSQFRSVFAQSSLRSRQNVLLYGPPGCGKTHIVRAAAAACSLRFISIKGPELLNKYIGASEQSVRDLFSKASSAAPCLLFFDEFESIAPKRGHDNTGVTDRVVNQLLTELDGVTALTGVFVFAATSRPDLLDGALLRPGRFDRLLFCDFPSWQERLDILTVHSRKIHLASDIDMGVLASETEGFSGADLRAILSEAHSEAALEFVRSSERNQLGRTPIVTKEILMPVFSKARPSTSEAERHRYNAIYSRFLDSVDPSTVQAREANKGKKATLA